MRKISVENFVFATLVVYLLITLQVKNYFTGTIQWSVYAMLIALSGGIILVRLRMEKKKIEAEKVQLKAQFKKQHGQDFDELLSGMLSVIEQPESFRKKYSPANRSDLWRIANDTTLPEKDRKIAEEMLKVQTD